MPHRIQRAAWLLPALLQLAASAGPRLDQVQVIGTHNSYHIAPHPFLEARIRAQDPEAADATAYTHRPLTDQLERLGIRQLELDLFADPSGGLFAEPAGIPTPEPNGGPSVPRPPEATMRKPGFKILHHPDFDFQSTVATFREALVEIREWSLAHPDHVPVFVLLELKGPSSKPTPTLPIEWTEPLLFAMEQEILEVFDPTHLLTPDEVRGAHPSLRQAIQNHGWPALAAVRGRILFALDNTDAVRELYLARSATLAQRLLFVSVDETHPAAAWFKINDPIANFDLIQQRVRQGYLVRTRADASTHEARHDDPRRRDAAFASGAQFISTDYPEPNPSWGTYHVRWPGGAVARPNVVSLPGVDPALDLEALAVPGLEPFETAELHHLNRRAYDVHRQRRLLEASVDYRRLLELEPPRRPTDIEAKRIRELLPELLTLMEEPFRLEDIVAIHHPDDFLIAYHLFWDDDIDFPDDNDPTDHEVVWVRYEPVSGVAQRVFTYFHGTILEGVPGRGRPRIAVEWGKHGSLPMDARGNTPRPAGLQNHWRRLNQSGAREASHPLASRWPKRFEADFTAYVNFTRAVDPTALLERSGHLWVGRWANALLDQHALPYNFAAKIEWPK